MTLVIGELDRGPDPQRNREAPVKPTLSLIIPTKNEAGNVDELIKRIGGAASEISIELIFVDDSTDETPELVAAYADFDKFPVRLIHRPPERRGNGLAGAVREGMAIARGDWVGVIDADLQHPPELVPQLLAAARNSQAKIAIASRYADSPRVLGLERGRSLISKLCIGLARIFFPTRLYNVTDPLSGYFVAHRDSIDLGRLNSRGFKILLEILVRFPDLPVVEMPFVFKERHAGKSKAVVLEGLRYVSLLGRLRVTEMRQRPFRFAIVGASGLIVNQLFLIALTDVGSLHYLVSAAIATQGSSLWNFVFTEHWVFHDREQRHGWAQRLFMFLAMNNASLLMRGPFLIFLTSALAIHYAVSNLITLLALVTARYLLSDRLIWAMKAGTPQGVERRNVDSIPLHHARRDGASNGTTPAFSYNVHNIIRIDSAARLPELEYFRVWDPTGEPDITIKVGASDASMNGSMNGSANGSHAAATNGHHLQYREVVGSLGFWADFSLADRIDVQVGRLLALSPHVLYTNIVEPIMRWTFVRKGYALVHAACVASSDGAVLVTARTDTGKTTTVLKTLSNNGHGCSFLSDDMTILGRDGQLMNYPKPLTISRHTLHATKGADLRLFERVALQLQSRVHSKSGRKTALTLAATRLPMATVNAIAQILIPPPKYTIERLIPGVTVTPSSKPARLLVIERGDEDSERPLQSAEALDVLFANSEDAYGFPPYPTLASHLYTWNGADLRVLEREIVTDGLRGCEATLLSNRGHDWWLWLSAFLHPHGTDRPA